MSLSEKVQQLNSEIGATVDRAIAEMRQEVSQWLRSSSEELVGRLAELRPAVPESFVAHGDLEPAVRSAAEELSSGARDAGREAGREDGRRDGLMEGRNEGRRIGVSELRDALGALDRARSQAEILAALLRESARWSSRSAILLLRGGEVRGWSSNGFDTTEAALREVNLGAPAEGSWSRAFQGQGPVRLSSAECAVLCSRLASPLPHEGVLVPLVLRDRVAAALYADQYDGSQLGAEALQVLCYTAALAIESLPFRERASTATLEPVHGEPAQPAPAPEPQAPAPEAVAPDTTEAPAPETTEETSEPEAYAEAEPEPAETHRTEALPAVGGWDSASAYEDDTVAEVTEVSEVTEVEVEAEADVTDVAAEPMAYDASPEPAPWASVEEPAYSDSPVAIAEPEEPPAETWSGPVAEVAEIAEEEEPSTPTQKIDLRTLSSIDAPAEPEPADSSPQATVLLQRSSLREAMTPTPVPVPAMPEPEPERPMPPPTPIRPVAPPPTPTLTSAPAATSGDTEAAPSAAGTPEVRPPSDLQGPGWAFASNRQPVSPNEEALHEEARRLARLLVSEIKLYNEEQVEEGRRKRDVYERLREDIDRSRQMYEERVEPRILKSTDYFYQELVRILAAGDARALGI